MAKHLIITLMLVASLSAWAQTDSVANVLTARKCFATVPISVIKVIDENTRLDMLDYFEHGMSTHSQNDIGFDCYVTSLTDDAITTVNGNGIEMQMFVLNPEDKLPMIGVIETLDTPVPDSNIHFYTSKWAHLDMLISVNPTLKDWIVPSARKKTAEVQRVIPFILAKYSYDPETRILTLTNNMKEYYSPKDTPVELSYLKPELRYRWDGNKFKLLK